MCFPIVLCLSDPVDATLRADEIKSVFRWEGGDQDTRITLDHLRTKAWRSSKARYLF